MNLEELLDEILDDMKSWYENQYEVGWGKEQKFTTDDAKDQLLSLFREEEKAKDQAYWERNQLVAVLSKLFPAHRAIHPTEDTDWEDDWRTIICIHTPAGQATWHIHSSETKYFEHLPIGDEHWDGHTTEEKYKRLANLLGGSDE